MSIHDYPSIFSRLRGLTAAQRAEVFYHAEQQWCWHCGGPQGACECGWPAAEPEEDPDRCVVCGWTYAASPEWGCTPDGCSYRPPEGTREWYRIRDRRAARDYAASLASPNPKEEP